MSAKIVYQLDFAGLYVCETKAFESPREPGHFLIPARCVEAAPPAEVPDGQWPRWNGVAWELITIQKPTAQASDADAVTKLQAFLAANPDVAALLG